MTLTKNYKLPAPELLDPADGPANFENLARAIEGQAYPTLQNWSSFSGNMFVLLHSGYISQTLYSEQIPTNNIRGWVDIDAYCWATQGYPPSGTAGTMTISVNGAQVGYTRYHNWWNVQNMPVYCSARWPNLTGAPATITVVIKLDGTSTPEQRLMCTGMSYQIYGAKVS